MLKYLTGYVVEKSLSLDNIFVIAMIFSYFKIESKSQHKILFWGILGAIILRGVMILLGAAFIEKFRWSTYLLGAILIYSAIQMMTARHDNVNYYKNPILKVLSKIYPVKWENRTLKFFIKNNGKRYMTASFATLIVIEFTDILFAVDSIPAILAITLDPFIVYTSNVFAILGLRALYFTLAGIMRLCLSIHYGLSAILVFVGMKMLLSDIYKIPVGIALGVIAGLLTISIIACMVRPRKEEICPVNPPVQEREPEPAPQSKGEP